MGECRIVSEVSVLRNPSCSP